MNNPSLVQPSTNVAALAAMKLKAAREADKQRNREIGQLLRQSTLHRPMVVRSLPHSRGR